MRHSDLKSILEDMQSSLNASDHLTRLGRLFAETMLFQVDDDEVYLHFRDGKLTEMSFGASRKIPWRFAFRCDRDALDRFWQPIPEPGFHDIFGLVKLGRGRIDGDILSLVKNLRFIKEFLALGRKGATA